MTTAAPPGRNGPAVDPREAEPWFAALPERAQDDLRQEWCRERKHAEVDRRRRRDRLVQSVIEGVALLAAVQLLFYRTGFLDLLVSVALGAGLGATWHAFGVGRYGAGLAALLAFAVQRLTCGMGSPVQVVYPLIVILCTAMACSIPRESERMGA